MSENKYPNTGVMFVRQKRSERGPDMGGDITIEGDVLDYVLKCAERGDECRLELSGWKRRTRDGSTMLSLRVELPYAVRQRGEDRGERRDDRRDDRRDIQTTRGTYRSNYGRPNPNHDTEIGGSHRDRYQGRRSPLDDL